MNATRRKASVVLLSMLGAAGAAVVAKPTRQVAEVGQGIVLDTMFPKHFGAWEVDPTIIPLAPAPELQKVLRETYDQTLGRTYRNKAGYRIMLSVAYGGRQTEGMNTHRPEVCYPAQGLSVIKGTWADNVAVGDRELPLRRMVAGNNRRHEPISYWLVVGRDVTDFGLRHKLTTLKYGLTGQIPDGMLVRVSSIDANEERSYAMQDAFVQDLMAALSPDHRQRLLGSIDR